MLGRLINSGAVKVVFSSVADMRRRVKLLYGAPSRGCGLIACRGGGGKFELVSKVGSVPRNRKIKNILEVNLCKVSYLLLWV
jgi:hypothetical protein